MTESAGDYVYGLPLMRDKDRGELEEFLADLVLIIAEKDPPSRLSNGYVCDALLAALDGLIKLPEDKQKLLEAIQVALDVN